MSGNLVINSIFSGFQKSLEEEQEVREVIRNICKEVDQISREITTVLQVIHHNEAGISPACLKARQLFEKANEGYGKLKEVVPPTDYYKYQDHWRYMTQRYCFLISLTIWLEKGILATHDTVAAVLGINSVTRGDYEKPLQISKFVMELNAGFRLLNLKNDHLRKRFDALKYDVKKIEEVVYDLSIRGLLPKPEAQDAPETSDVKTDS
ncbi:jg18772 [Pararge aegeria aegeria]|uniref:Translin n=1 Tax=Pararge aegeria aegeria TaxID=348720 RepID=A0A8S4S3T4_9NEOP|nr:jg18772 [Pararge aegeria aegeria]